MQPSAPARERLLAAAIDHVARNGLSDQSLRTIAAALGTSHRMLIYHFGSKEGLLVEIVRAVEIRQREVFAELLADTDASARELIVGMYERLIDPALQPMERLFFELYGQALQGRSHTAPLLEGIVESWIEPIAEVGRRQGMDPETARTNARLMIAVARGMLLDYLATGDAEAMRAMMEHFLSLLER
ncbi:MAG TPA: TetR/AcrR family transcriptional regulator [Mycobacteriales bacterium]|nr:TetR/AcrR family transcriptional regulator [Mycobacteriales bacterium]